MKNIPVKKFSMKTKFQNEVKMKNDEILLINPPFSDINNPYISIPILAGYLKSKNIPVSGYDLNSELYYKMITPLNIKEGKDYLIERFVDLNNKNKLTFSENFEYWVTCYALLEMTKYHSDFEKVFMPFFNFDDVQNMPPKIKNMYIRICSMKNYPEVILPEPFFKITSPYDPFNSNEIILSIRDDTYYTRVYKEVLESIIIERRPGIVGFSVVYRHQVIPAFQCAAFVKANFPGIHVTLGGPFITIYMQQIKNKDIFSYTDSLIIEEGEIPLETLSLELKKENPDLSKIPGLIYMDKQEIHYNQAATPKKLEDTPVPDYNIFQLDKYLNPIDKILIPIRLSKGCNWQKCSFCRTDLKFVKFYDKPKNFQVPYDRLKRVIEETGITRFQFSDESAPLDVLRFVCENLIKDNIKIEWITHTRVDKRLTRELCDLFKEAGCNQIALGVESLNNRILKLMQKGTTVELIEEVLGDVGGVVPFLAYMIVGFPTETEEEAWNGYKKMKWFKDNGLIKNYLYNTLILPWNSKIFNSPEEFGISDIRPPANQDLLPDIYQYNCEGMSREKAFKLMMDFNYEILMPKIYLNSKEIKIDNMIIPLRYDLHEVYTKYRGCWEIIFESFRHWLEIGNKKQEDMKAISLST
jgi:hypothetical protein